LILVDANVLLYAYDSGAPQHDRCRGWLERALAGPALLAHSWLTILAFLRLSTQVRVFQVPMPMSEALGAVSEWLAMPNAVMLDPGERYWEILARLIDTGQVRGPLVSDAALAALALEHGATVCTTDRDFKRFDGLRLIDPLAA
jgi:uncharacterized protein